jgi:hypothetical protein
MKGKWILPGIGLVLVMAGLVVAGIRRVNQVPFFRDEKVGVGGLHAKVFEFQPYYLYSFEQKGGRFMKVLYLKNYWQPRVATLWLSGNYGETELEEVTTIPDTLKFGKRHRDFFFLGGF